MSELIAPSAIYWRQRAEQAESALAAMRACVSSALSDQHTSVPLPRVDAAPPDYERAIRAMVSELMGDVAAMTVERDNWKSEAAALQRFFNTITDTNLTASRAELDARDALLDRARPIIQEAAYESAEDGEGYALTALLRDIDARKGGA